MSDCCPWCGHETCDGETPAYPHHSLCCLDGSRRPCWGRSPEQPDKRRDYDGEADDDAAEREQERRWSA